MLPGEPTHMPWLSRALLLPPVSLTTWLEFVQLILPHRTSLPVSNYKKEDNVNLNLKNKVYTPKAMRLKK